MTETPKAVANSAQSEYWNAKAGDAWTQNQAIMDRLLSGPGRRLFEHAAIKAGERVLDIGCGTGATVLAAADAVGPEGGVLGIDLSHAMLDLARSRAKQHAGTAELMFEIADAQSHQFAAGRHDLLLSRFGVMFFEDPTAAFANLLTALRPGGRLCFVCWAPMAENPWFFIPRDAAIKFLGAPEAAPPRAPGPLAFADTDYVTEILTGAGFRDISVLSETVDLTPISDLIEAADYALNMGPASRIIENHDPSPETLAAIGAEIESRLSVYYDGTDEARVPSSLHFVQARRP